MPDERNLLLRIQLARHRFRLAMLHPKPMQQRDQARAALIDDAERLLDPGTNRAGRSRQRLGDPCFQLLLLQITQPASAAVVAEAHQAIETVLLIKSIPGADWVIVEKQHSGN